MNDARDTVRAWLALLTACNTIKKTLDARMRRTFDLSLSRFDVLAALDRAGEEGFSASALSAHLKVTEGNTTQVTAPLVAAGLVSRTTSASDGRMAIFRMTAKGHRVFSTMAEANREWVARAFSPLTPDEIATLRDILHTLNHPGQTEEKVA